MTFAGGRTANALGLASRALALGGALLVSGGAHATAGTANDVFTIANYPVEARARDAVTAKTQAVADGQQAALRSLFRRLVPVTAYPKLKAMPPVRASDIIDGVSVRSERNSTTDYTATLDFSFQPTPVRDALRRDGIPFVDSQAPETILIPVYRARPNAALESGGGAWFEAWQGLDLAHTLSPLKLMGLNPGIPADAVAAVVGKSAAIDRIFTSEYKTDRLIVAFAEPDATVRKLNVTLTGADAVGSFSLTRSYRISGGDSAYTAELAAVVGLGVLEGRWKAAKGGAIGGVDLTAAGGDAIPIVAEFATLSEWNDIRTRILDTDGAFDVTIGSVSARSAEVSVRHPGGAQGLADAFASHGLTMENTRGTWLVHSTF